jgi:hypothetical protein
MEIRTLLVLFTSVLTMPRVMTSSEVDYLFSYLATFDYPQNPQRGEKLQKKKKKKKFGKWDEEVVLLVHQPKTLICFPGFRNFPLGNGPLKRAFKTTSERMSPPQLAGWFPLAGLVH